MQKGKTTFPLVGTGGLKAPNRVPDFLYVGPPKSASTWLFRVLSAHPQVFVPVAKDIYYFDQNYSRGREWYASFFEPALPGTMKGEISHDYLYSEAAVERIARDLPDVKIITILRNPIERSISHFRYSARNGTVPYDFEQACVANGKILDNSRYATYLRPWQRTFAPGRLGVFWYDDLQANPRDFIQRICSFIGVPYCAELPIDDRVNVASVPRWKLSAVAASRSAALLRRFGFQTLLGELKRGPLRHLLYRKDAAEPQAFVSQSFRAYLKTYFEPEISGLEETYGRDLSSWRNR